MSVPGGFGFGFRVSGFGFRVSGWGLRFRVSGLGFRVSGFAYLNEVFENLGDEREAQDDVDHEQRVVCNVHNQPDWRFGFYHQERLRWGLWGGV